MERGTVLILTRLSAQSGCYFTLYVLTYGTNVIIERVLAYSDIIMNAVLENLTATTCTHTHTARKLNIKTNLLSLRPRKLLRCVPAKNAVKTQFVPANTVHYILRLVNSEVERTKIVLHKLSGANRCI